MQVNPSQYVSPESDRAEAERGCSKCGKKGHYARTCKGDAAKAAPAADAPSASKMLAPEGSARLGRVDLLRDANVYPPSGWDPKTSINYEDTHVRNRHKWQIWRAVDGWIYVWHDDVCRVTMIGPSNVCFAEPFPG